VFALDCNTIIYALKGKGEVRERLQDTDIRQIAIPAVVVYELEVGTLGSENPVRRRRELHMLLGVLKILPFDVASAERAAQLRLELEQAGMKIGPMDNLIAGTVLAHHATLVTHSLDEFSRVPGLRVEDWF